MRFNFENKTINNNQEEIKAARKNKEVKSNDVEGGMTRRKILKLATIATVLAVPGIKYLMNKDNKSNSAKAMRDKEEKVKEEVEYLSSGKKEKIKSEEEKIADEVLRVFTSPDITKRIDHSVFTTDFYIAQQFQESRGDASAVSNAGAKGVYQNLPTSIRDVIRYLNILKRKGLSDYDGPKEISSEMSDKIGNLFAKKSDYGRAFGKLYLQFIHDPESPYNTGMNEDVFRGESIDKQQELLLISYHDGPKVRYKPDDASGNAKYYVEAVFGHMEQIYELRTKFEENELSPKMNYAILKILRELDRKENKKSEQNKNKTINHWISKLRQKTRSKRMLTRDKNAVLNNQEIRKIFL